MNPGTWQTVRIGTALAVIFASGIAVGLALRPGSRGVPAAPAVPAAGTNVLPGGLPMTVSVTRNDADTLVANLAVQLDLTEEQRRGFRAVAVEWAAEARHAPQRSKARRDLFEKFVPRFRELLDPERAKRYDEILENHRFRRNRNARFDESVDGRGTVSTNGR